MIYLCAACVCSSIAAAAAPAIAEAQCRNNGQTVNTCSLFTRVTLLFHESTTMFCSYCVHNHYNSRAALAQVNGIHISVSTSASVAAILTQKNKRANAVNLKSATDIGRMVCSQLASINRQSRHNRTDIDSWYCIGYLYGRCRNLLAPMREAVDVGVRQCT